MKLYRTAKDNLINLDDVTEIYRSNDQSPYTVIYKGGRVRTVPELTVEDIDNIMDYNNYLID